MSYQHLDADECEICWCYSNAGFDLCKDCAFEFTKYVHDNFKGKNITVKQIKKEYDKYCELKQKR